MSGPGHPCSMPSAHPFDDDCQRHFVSPTRTESFSATMTWAVNGMHGVPNDPEVERGRSGRDGWQFRGDAAWKVGKAPMDFEFHRQVVPSKLKVKLSPAGKISRTKEGLALRLTIANESDSEMATTMSHEWHGGEWPTTALYASVLAWRKRARSSFSRFTCSAKIRRRQKRFRSLPGKRSRSNCAWTGQEPAR